MKKLLAVLLAWWFCAGPLAVRAEQHDRDGCFSWGIRPTGVTVSPNFSMPTGNRPLVGYNLSLTTVGLSWNCIEIDGQVGSGFSSHGRAGTYYFLGGGARWYPLGHYRNQSGWVAGIYGSGVTSLGVELVEKDCCGQRERVFQIGGGGGLEAGWGEPFGEFLLFGEASAQYTYIRERGFPLVMDPDDVRLRWMVGIRVRAFTIRAK